MSAMTQTLLLYLIVLSSIGTIFGLLARNMADRKGYDGIHYFWLAFFTTVIGLLVVIGLPDLNIYKQNQKIIELLSKK